MKRSKCYYETWWCNTMDFLFTSKEQKESKQKNLLSESILCREILFTMFLCYCQGPIAQNVWIPIHVGHFPLKNKNKNREHFKQQTPRGRKGCLFVLLLRINTVTHLNLFALNRLLYYWPGFRPHATRQIIWRSQIENIMLH